LINEKRMRLARPVVCMAKIRKFERVTENSDVCVIIFQEGVDRIHEGLSDHVVIFEFQYRRELADQYYFYLLPSCTEWCEK
jgi:hypothetical protein